MPVPGVSSSACAMASCNSLLIRLYALLMMVANVYWPLLIRSKHPKSELFDY